MPTQADGQKDPFHSSAPSAAESAVVFGSRKCYHNQRKIFLLVVGSSILFSVIYIFYSNSTYSTNFATFYNSAYNHNVRYYWRNRKVRVNSLSLQGYPIFPRKPQSGDKTSKEGIKTILLWTKLFGYQNWKLPGSLDSSEPFEQLKCKYRKCFITNDRNKLPEADVVLINFRDDFDYNDRPKPNERLPNQLWTFVLWETPDHTYSWIWQDSQKAYRKLKDFAGFFNWTMTYRLDSDVRFNYGEFIPKMEPDMSRIAVDRLVGKSKSVVWMNSHCDTASHREIYVKELMKYIDIDTVGGCSEDITGLTSGICVRKSHLEGTEEECLAYLSSTYKFYLSFENSLCKDYVTEKFYRAAMLDLIPVVLNGANMSLFAPPHSYIDAQDFDSPKELAAYLEMVASQSELYNSYFWWKPFYDVVQQWERSEFVKHFCDLCEKIHKYDLEKDGRNIYQDIDNWWTTDGKCYEGKTGFY